VAVGLAAFQEGLCCFLLLLLSLGLVGWVIVGGLARGGDVCLSKGGGVAFLG
jgi:hypothetical protein